VGGLGISFYLRRSLGGGLGCFGEKCRKEGTEGGGEGGTCKAALQWLARM